MSVYAIEKATGSLEVLIRLYFRGPTQKSDLFDDLKPNHQTISKTLQTLRVLGLVQCQEGQSFPYRHLCALTNAGRRLVESPLHRWPTLLWDGRVATTGDNQIRNDKRASTVLARLQVS